MKFRGRGLSTEHLQVAAKAIEDNLSNRMPAGSLNLYYPAARKKLDEIAWAITDNMAEARKLKGDPVKADGYSGSQTRRHR